MRSFGSLVAGIMTKREGKCPKGALIHRTDEGAPEKLPEGDWLYEIKFDGYWALAFKDGKDVRLTSRNQKEFNYPQLLDALKLLPAERAILDGEIAALALRSSFSKYSKALVMSRWSILPLICSFWMGRICANSDSAPSVNSWLSCLKKLLRTSGSPVSFAAAKTNCSALLKNSASRDWSLRNRIQSTKAAGAVVPG
jgi:hypothetical protein